MDRVSKSGFIAAIAVVVSILALAANSYFLFYAQGQNPSETTVEKPAADLQVKDRIDVNASLAELRQEVVRLRADLAAGKEAQDPDRVEVDSATEDSDQRVEMEASQLQEDPTYREPPLSTRFVDERGQSDWGTATSGSINASAQENPFFLRLGGDVTADCKKTVCRVEWPPPALDDLPAQERAEGIAMARYEMLALAARSADDVGQMTAEWVPDDSGETLRVTFERSESP